VIADNPVLPPSGPDGAARTVRALERCIRSDSRRFFDEIWAQRPVLVEQRDPDGFGDLLSLGSVDRILAGTFPRRPAVRLVKDGNEVAPSTYVRTVSLGSEWLRDVIDPGRVYDAFQHGATIVIQGLQRYWEPIVRFARDLELELSHPVQVNAYISPPGTRGLGVHYDTHDVFVLQIGGSKQWNVHERAVVHPLPHQRSKTVPTAEHSSIAAELRPGQSLYIPRGFLHEAIATSQISVHLTVGILAYTWHDLFEEIFAGTQEVVDFREALPPGFGDDLEALRPAISRKLRALAAWIEEQDPDALGARLAKRFYSSRTPIRFGQFEQLALVDALDMKSVVRLRPGCVIKLEPGSAGRLQAVLGDRTLVMPAPLESAMRYVALGDVFTAAELETFEDAESSITFIRRLVREGVLEIVGL
jgi:hypothetical protein